MKRVTKDTYYLKIAEEVAKRSTCLRRNYGAVIVNNDEIVSTGHNGAPRGETNCIDSGSCAREALGVAKGERYELCCAVHAEQNAIISAARREMLGGTIYITGLEQNGSYANPTPCIMCRRFIKNAGIKRCIGMVDGVPKEISLEPPAEEQSEQETVVDVLKKALADVQDYRLKHQSRFYPEESARCIHQGMYRGTTGAS